MRGAVFGSLAAGSRGSVGVVEATVRTSPKDSRDDPEQSHFKPSFGTRSDYRESISQETRARPPPITSHWCNHTPEKTIHAPHIPTPTMDRCVLDPQAPLGVSDEIVDHVVCRKPQELAAAIGQRHGVRVSAVLCAGLLPHGICHRHGLHDAADHLHGVRQWLDVYQFVLIPRRHHSTVTVQGQRRLGPKWAGPKPDGSACAITLPRQSGWRRRNPVKLKCIGAAVHSHCEEQVTISVSIPARRRRVEHRHLATPVPLHRTAPGPATHPYPALIECPIGMPSGGPGILDVPEDQPPRVGGYGIGTQEFTRSRAHSSTRFNEVAVVVIPMDETLPYIGHPHATRGIKCNRLNPAESHAGLGRDHSKRLQSPQRRLAANSDHGISSGGVNRDRHISGWGF
jgi:hypothetical protein